MKIILDNRTKQKLNSGSMKSVFEKRSRIILSGVPGSPASQASFRILENDDFRITESGDFRILE